MIAAVACGGDEEPTPTQQTEPTNTPTNGGADPTATPDNGDPATATPGGDATATAQPSNGGDLPAPESPAGEAVVVLGALAVRDENGLNRAQAQESIHYYGIGETMFRRSEDDEVVPWIAEGFDVADDLSGATLNIRQGIQFHDQYGDFGELTAEDVAFSMNDANATTTLDSIHGQSGDFAGLWGEWRVVDEYTIEFDFVNYDATWALDYLNDSGQSFVVFSKQAYDQNGADWARDNVVATGPYQPVEWERDSRLVMEAVDDHYMFEPQTDRITILEIGEATTRNSMLRTGEADATTVEVKDAPDLRDTGFLTTDTGGANQEGIFFSGNLWEKEHALTGEPLERLTYAADFAWIGDPDDPEDMEEARMVRYALAIAIDRQQANDALLAGLGREVHVQYFSTAHSRWDEKWEYPYDPEEARNIISNLDATYQTVDNGQLNGNAFEVSLYSQDGATNVRGEIADLVAGYWAELGLQTYALKHAYQAFRPSVVARTNTFPWVTQCDKGNESNPWHFPKGLVQTSLSRGGFSCGFESPDILDFYNRMATAEDQAEASQAADEYLDYVYHWNLQPGVVATPNFVFYNPEKIASWEMDTYATTTNGSYWNLTLR